MQTILSRLDHPLTGGFLGKVLLVGQMVNLFVPARAGEFVRAQLLKAKRTIPYTTGFASITTERLFDFTTLLLAVLVASAWIVATGELAPLLETASRFAATRQVALVGAIFVGVASLLAVVALAIISRTRGDWVPVGLVPGSDGRIPTEGVEHLRSFLRAASRPVGEVRSFLHVAGLSLLVWTFEIASFTVVLVGLGVDLPPTELVPLCVLAVATGNLAKVIPISPSGIGLYEATVGFVLASMSGLELSLVLTAALLDHLLKVLVTAAAGGVSLSLIDVHVRGLLDDEGEEPSIAD